MPMPDVKFTWKETWKNKMPAGIDFRCLDGLFDFDEY